MNWRCVPAGQRFALSAALLMRRGSGMGGVAGGVPRRGGSGRPKRREVRTRLRGRIDRSAGLERGGDFPPQIRGFPLFKRRLAVVVCRLKRGFAGGGFAAY
jgi:hypothetical protein